QRASARRTRAPAARAARQSWQQTGRVAADARPGQQPDHGRRSSDQSRTGVERGRVRRGHAGGRIDRNEAPKARAGSRLEELIAVHEVVLKVAQLGLRGSRAALGFGSSNPAMRANAAIGASPRRRHVGSGAGGRHGRASRLHQEGALVRVRTLVIGLTTATFACSTAAPAIAAPADGIRNIQHVVMIMQENRSFDTYFGTYPGANGIPAGVCVPNPQSGGCVAPFYDGEAKNFGGPHGANAAIEDIDGGKMDGFVAQAEGALGCNETGGCLTCG